MGRKKPFIKKGEGVKFFLVHRSQKDPLYLADDLGEHVLMPADPEQAVDSGLLPRLGASAAVKRAEEKEARERRLKEQQKYGVYYEDDYDYLQHLREINPDQDEDAEDKEEKTLQIDSVLIKTDAFGDDQQAPPNSTKQSNKLVLPSTVFASKFEEDVGYFNQAAPDHDPKINWDPDIVRLLDEDADIEAEDNGELEDDFFVKANQEKSKWREKKDDEEDDYEDAEEDEEDNLSNRADNDYDDDDDYDDEEGSETRSMRDLEKKSRFSEYSMSSSVIRRNEGLKLLDEQFERMFAQYDDDQIGALDTEEIEGFRGQDAVLNAALEEFSKMMEKKGLVTDKVPKSNNTTTKLRRLPALAEKNEDGNDDQEENEDEDEEEEEEEEESSSSSHDSDTEMLRFDCKREREDRLDCESVISTYSNIYNHPATIKSDDDNNDESSRIRLSKKSGLPLGVLKEKEKSKRELERIEHNIVRVLPDLPLKRDPNESKEEKRERKQAIKAHRRERRVEKKINKMAFKEEKKTQVGQITNFLINKTLVKLPL